MPKITAQVKKLEQASRGEEVRKALIEALTVVNVFHSTKFKTKAEPDSFTISAGIKA